jgi:type VI secretion system (T6SS) baseplate-like injector VgrG
MQGSTMAAQTKAGRHYGKYRGIVSDNGDPKKLGRLRARVPEILGDVDTGWALPCAPYAGHQSGAYTVPSAGTGVWIEFESGVVSRPIWTGCWWGTGDIPTDEGGADATPDVKILRSESGLMVALHDDDDSIAISDHNGQNLLHIQVQQGTVTVKAAAKVVVDAPQIELVSGASHPLVFGDQLLQYLTQLVTMFNTHVHPGELAAGVLPVTPMIPAPPLQPPTPALLSLQVMTG